MVESATISESRPRLRPFAVVAGVFIGLGILYSLVLLAAALGWTGKKPRSSFESLGDKDEVVRRLAARQLGERPGPDVGEAVTALATALHDQDKNVRWEAAAALGRLGPQASAALPALRQALTDKDDRVRDRAALAIEKISSNVADQPSVE